MYKKQRGHGWRLREKDRDKDYKIDIMWGT